jgi:hypothetical protein
MIGEMGLNGDVQSRMDAYRGNPQALMQRYAQSQELVDLLALQKLKSEKESAAREMQMQMESAGLPTVAQQREQEVMDLTKKEVAQQSGIGGQQQAQQQQQAMKSLMQAAGAPQGATGAQTPQPNQPPRTAGVAGLPSPNMMPPKAMASGGIVAFAAGDPVPAPEDDEEERRRKASMGGLAEQGIRSLMSYSPERLRESRSREAMEALNLTPEERAQREQQIQEMSQYDERMTSPERRRSEGLTRWLLGAANRSGIGSTLAGAGAASTNYQNAMDEMARKRMMERQKRETELTDVGRGARAGAFEAGAEGEKLGLEALGRGTSAAGSLQEAMIRASSSGSGSNDVLKAYQDAQRVLSANPDYKALVDEEKAAAKFLQELGETGQGPVGDPYREKLAAIQQRRKQMEDAFFQQQDQAAVLGRQMMQNALGQGQTQQGQPTGGSVLRFDEQGNLIQ